MVRRRIYGTPWYKKKEKMFVGALSVRFGMIRWREEVLTAEEFIAVVLTPGQGQKYATSLAEVVHIIDERARKCR